MGIQEVNSQLPVTHINETQKGEIKKVQHGNASKDSISSAATDLYSLDVKVALKDSVNHKQQTNQTNTCNSTCVGCVQTDSGCHQTQTCNSC